MSPATFHALRLKPGQDLKKTLMDWARVQEMKACAIVTCVGSLTTANLRLAAGKGSTSFQGPFEIVSLAGTFSNAGGHFHISLANPLGQVIGGHLLEGNAILTTAEVVIAELPQAQFLRDLDAETGFWELKIK